MAVRKKIDNVYAVKAEIIVEPIKGITYEIKYKMVNF